MTDAECLGYVNVCSIYRVDLSMPGLLLFRGYFAGI